MPTAPEEMTLKVIAHIHTAFPTKFGIPRQSGLVDELRGEVIFTPEYRNADAVRGLEDFSHIWLVWQFSGAVRDSWSPLYARRAWRQHPHGRVRHPVAVPPQSSGPSSVRLEGIEHRPDVGPVLIVRGADLMDGTPSTTSSLTSPMPTATRMPPRALPARPSSTVCRYSSRPNCWHRCRRPTAPP